jgi:hypothetical protein
MARNNTRSRNNNPEGRNQYSNGWTDTVRENPVTTAAAAAAAVGAGVFLWSKRNEISGQISRLSDQITDWAEDMRSNIGSSDRELALTEGPNESSAIESSRSTAKRSTSTRSNGSGRSTSATSGTQSNQTTGGRSEGANQTF